MSIQSKERQVGGWCAWKRRRHAEGMLARATPASGFLEAGYPDCSQDEPTVLTAIGRHGNAQWQEHTEFGVRWRARSSHPGLG